VAVVHTKKVEDVRTKILNLGLFFLCLVLLCSCERLEKTPEPPTSSGKATKLVWIIPDGFRAEDDLFKVYEWAQEGKLPNIRKMMDNGAYGYCIPSFPSHTPTNFATLLTGAYPEVHGVADGPMRAEGYPLNKPAVAGFSSVAKKVPPIWVTLEKAGKKVALVSMPGSTPPELENGIVIRGRWSGWGADFHALNFERDDNGSGRIKLGRNSRLFFLGAELTRFIKAQPAANWSDAPESFSPGLQAAMNGYGSTVYAYIYDGSDDKKVNYDTILFSRNKKDILARLGQGQWSDWVPTTLKWTNVSVDSYVAINVIKLDDNGFFRVRFFYDNSNRFIVQPPEVAGELEQAIGPMVDFVDNFPPQLIYYPEDKDTFLTEAEMSFKWHKKAIPFILQKYKPDVLIHDIYTPNQMLTSRWWMGYVDPNSRRYNDVTEAERQELWSEVFSMYQKMDDLLGEVLKNVDNDTLVVFSSDHGVVPLDRYVRLNNLFAREGLLKFSINSTTGEPIVDWNKTKVIFIKMDSVYINPNGLAGNYKRASGEEYEQLRERVVKLLNELEDPATGVRPAIAVVRWEDAPERLRLPQDRVGDLVVANEAGYGWSEDMSEDLKIFDVPLETGYKQAILAENITGMRTPFIVMGPGIKKGYKLPKPVNTVDQYPTIMRALGEESPGFVQGRVLDEIFQ
jgi:predicted AlkP superfamily phosphohydrolase/phosphomutase